MKIEHSVPPSIFQVHQSQHFPNPIKEEGIQKANTIMADSFPDPQHIEDVKQSNTDMELTFLNVTVDSDGVGFRFKRPFIDM